MERRLTKDTASLPSSPSFGVGQVRETLTDDVFYLLAWASSHGWFSRVGREESILPSGPSEAAQLLQAVLEATGEEEQTANAELLEDLFEPDCFRPLLRSLLVRTTQTDAELTGQLLVEIARHWSRRPLPEIAGLEDVVRQEFMPRRTRARRRPGPDRTAKLRDARGRAGRTLRPKH